MPSTFTPNLGLEKIAPGEQDNSWGDTTDANFNRIDAALGWRVAATADVSPSSDAVSLAVPAGARRIRLEWQECSGPSPASLYAQLSFDGGVTYDNGPTAYFYAVQAITNQIIAESTGGTSGALILTPNTLAPNTLAVFGDLDMDTGRRSSLWRVHGGQQDGTVLTVTGGGWCNVGGTLTHIRIGFFGVPMTAGRFKLLASA